MARPLKDGVDYFPKDTDFYGDDKVRLLRAEFGAKGMYMLDYILCEIYKKNGYFLPWDKNRCFLVSDGAGCGCGPEYISEFIAGCIRCSFFDKRVFESFGVLTSAGIQRRYIRMFNSRDEISILKEYWLLDDTSKKDVPASVLNKITFKTLKSTENPDKSTENPDKSTENPQSKLEDTNVSQNKTNKKTLESEFDELWSLYPRKEGKDRALTAYIRHRKKGTTFDEVKAGIENYNRHIRANGIVRKYIKQGSTYFNGANWKDVYEDIGKGIRNHNLDNVF